MGKGCEVSPSAWGACRGGCRRVRGIVVGFCWSCGPTCRTASGPPGGGFEQQRHSRSVNDRQAAGQRRAGQSSGGLDR